MTTYRACVAWLALLAAPLILGCGKSGATPETAEEPKTPPVEIGSAMQKDTNPTVVLRTSHGVIKLRLNAEKAPITVDNFLNQVASGFYDQTIFHQVEKGYVVLGGGYRDNLVEKPSRYSIVNEADNGLSNRRGTVAMARPLDGIESSTGQFFINLSDNTDLDHRGPTAEKYGFCVFGEVIEGMNVVEKIAQVETGAQGDLPSVPVKTVMIESATLVR